MMSSRQIKLVAIATAFFALHCSSNATPSPSADNNPQNGGGVYNSGAGGGIGGAIPGGGGAIQGGGGASTGGGGAIPGGGGAIPGGGGAIPGGGGAPPLGGAPAYTVDPVGNMNRAPGFVDLSPPMGAALDDTGSTVTPAAPTGWIWHDIPGAICRDGSATGFYRHKGTADKLLIYLEGGGACSNDHFCAFNPANVNQILAGDGQTVLGSTAGAIAGRQQPGGYTGGTPMGIFDMSNAANPFKDWSQIYIPYCTGDVFFGTKKDGMVPNRAAPQQFVGYDDMKLFIGRIVPTYKDKVSKVVVAGASAGGFGVALNFSMISDAFGNIPVAALDDSGPPFDDKYMPVCMQKRWRDGWGFSGSLPPDCKECQQADGGGLVHLSDFLLRKHPKASISIISSMQDEVIRLFYSVGLASCANYDTADPVAITLLQTDPMTYFPAQQYQDGLTDLRAKYKATGKLATYYIAGANPTYHQHIFRARFFDPAQGTESIAQFTTNFLAGTIETIGP